MTNASNTFIIRATSKPVTAARDTAIKKQLKSFMASLGGFKTIAGNNSTDLSYVSKVKKTRDVLAALKTEFKCKFSRNDGNGSPWETTIKLDGFEVELAVNDSTTYEICKPGEVRVDFMFD